MQAKRFYRPELDILRFFCFFLVYLHHALPRNGPAWLAVFAEACGFGVPVFFLLSSFLITELLLLEKQTTATVHMRAFYARRILRIWPLYFGFFGVCWLLGATHHLPAIPWQMTLSFFLLAGNWYFTHIAMFASPAGILWSVSIEEQFYLLWPWLLKLAGRRGVVLGSLALLPLSYFSIYWLELRGTGTDPGLWADTMTHIQFFAAGGLLAVFLRQRIFRLGWPLRLGCGLLTFATWTIAVRFCQIKSGPAIPPLLACAGYALVALGALSFFFVFYGMRLGTAPGTRTLQYLGKISYGLYVFHILMIGQGARIAWATFRALHLPLVPTQIAMCAAAVGLVFTVLAAWASYEAFEKPFLRWKEKFTFIRSRAA